MIPGQAMKQPPGPREGGGGLRVTAMASGRLCLWGEGAPSMSQASVPIPGSSFSTRGRCPYRAHAGTENQGNWDYVTNFKSWLAMRANAVIIIITINNNRS